MSQTHILVITLGALAGLPLGYWLAWLVQIGSVPRVVAILVVAWQRKLTCRDIELLAAHLSLLDQVPPVGGAPGHSSPAGLARSGAFHPNSKRR